MVTCKQGEGRQWEGEEEEEEENENGNGNEEVEVEGQQQLVQHAQRQHQRHQSVPRTLVYDVESGSLRFPKSQRTAAATAITTTHKVLQHKAPPHAKSVKGEQQGNNHFLKLHSESCSGRKQARKKKKLSFFLSVILSCVPKHSLPCSTPYK